MTADERALCITTAHFVGSYRVMAAISLIATALGLGLLFIGSHDFSMFMIATVLLGLIERYLALRLQFDAGLFEKLSSSEQFNLLNMDAALQALGLRKATAATRSLASRINGSVRLFRLHAMFVLVQLTVLVVAAFI